MSDPYDVPIKVVDRRRWAHAEDAVGGDAVAWKPTYVEELEEKLAQREKDAEEYLSKYRQASKEFEDARARMRKELAKDAERIAPRPPSGQAGAEGGDVLLQGVEMVRDQFLAKLDGFGVKRIENEGGRFDPLLHEAVSTVPAADPASDGIIAGVVRHGYRIGDEILRPALVAVAKSGQLVD